MTKYFKTTRSTDSLKEQMHFVAITSDPYVKYNTPAYNYFE